MTRVAFDARMWRYLGVGRYVQSLLKPAIRDPRFRFTILGGAQQIRPLLAGTPHRLVPLACGPYHLPTAVRYPAPPGSGVLHVPHYSLPFFAKGACVVTIHDLIPLLFPRTVSNPAGLPLILFWHLFAARRAAKIIAVSRHTKKDLVLRLRVPAEKVVVIHEGADLHLFFPPGKDEAPPLDGPYLLYVGSVRYHKNLPRLLQAFALLRKTRRLPHRLVLAGDGGEDPGLRRLASQLGVADRLHFIRRPGASLLRRLYGFCACLVYPSLYEGFGLPPLEAQACGAPVVASRTASIPEVCGRGALYFSPRDSLGLARQIERALDDPPLVARLRARGAANVRRFSWERAWQATAAVYLEAGGA